MKNTPSHLFHYTSIDNLCLILKNRTIRFQRLDKMNDPEEGKTESFPEAKYFTYVSCWTAEKNNEESLPLWNMYSSDMRGVRIRLPINMFKGRNIPDDKVTGYPIINAEHPIFIKRKNSHFPGMIIGPLNIQYQKDPKNTEKCFEINDDATVDVNLLHIGQVKHEHWSFEKEWRYKIIGMPFEGKWNIKDYDQFLTAPQNQYIDVGLDNSVISEMIIQLGPKATFSDTIIVDLLVKEFAKGAIVCDSSIKVNQ